MLYHLAPIVESIFWSNCNMIKLMELVKVAEACRGAHWLCRVQLGRHGSLFLLLLEELLVEVVCWYRKQISKPSAAVAVQWALFATKQCCPQFQLQSHCKPKRSPVIQINRSLFYVCGVRDIVSLDTQQDRWTIVVQLNLVITKLKKF